MNYFSYAHLHQFTFNILLKIGCSEADATTGADVLLSADLRGVDSHGVARLIAYVRLWDKGRINTTPKLRVSYETPSSAVVDGDGGLGLVVAPFAMRVAMEKATNVGTGWVSVKNSNHYGIAGYHAMMALAQDMIGISMTNASPLMAPTFSKERLLGTNPISVAIPANEEPPFVLDMATTTAANGKLEMLQRKDQETPSGWVQDEAGTPTNSANAVKHGGALLPLGGDREHGSHKGYGLGAVVDIFSAVLSGANYGPWVPPFTTFQEPLSNPVGQGVGHFFGAMRVDAFRPADEFKGHMDQWIRTFRSATPTPGNEKVLIPGDPEREQEALRYKEGIPLLNPVIQDLSSLGTRFGLKF